MKTLLFLFGNEVIHFNWVTFSVEYHRPLQKNLSEKNGQFQEGYDTSCAVKIMERRKNRKKIGICWRVVEKKIGDFREISM